MVVCFLLTALVHKARKFLKCNGERSTDTEDKNFEGISLNNLNETEAKESVKEVISLSNSYKLSNEELLKRISFRAENFIEHVEATALYDTVLWYFEIENTYLTLMHCFLIGINHI